MRTALLLALVVAAPVALAGGSCLPSCDVPSYGNAFLPPLTVVASGSTVTWSSLDIPHTATERVASGLPCFHVAYGPGSPGSATLRVDAGAVKALAGNFERTCSAASTILADGTSVLPYHCLFHGNMRALLLVTT